MKLEYIGHSCFLITLSDGLRWVTDPYDGSIGLAAPDVSADVTTVSHSHYDHNCVGALRSAGRVLSAEGAYAVRDAKFEMIKCYHDEVRGKKRGENLITICEADGLRICHMGDIGHQPDAALLKKLGGIDLLLLPVGGTYTLDGAGAAQAVRAINPRAAIPMHFSVPRLELNISGPEPFIAACGGKCRECGGALEFSAEAPLSGIILMKPLR